MGEIAKRESAVLTVADLKTQINTIQKVLREVMQKGTHYDVVPGCGSKETLLKAGAEKILSTFRIGVNIEVADLGNENERRYRVTAKGFYIPTGNPIGSGVGECSTAEKKYAWRSVVCVQEFDNTPEDRRQIYYKPGYKSGQFEEVKQVKTNPADIANTVLKMAKKRAIVDLCLSATACSDIFTQDLEEDPEPPTGKPEQKQETKPAGNLISEPQAKRLFAILSSKESKRTQEELKVYLAEKYGLNSSREIDKADYEKIINWIEGK